MTSIPSDTDVRLEELHCKVLEAECMFKTYVQALGDMPESLCTTRLAGYVEALRDLNREICLLRRPTSVRARPSIPDFEGLATKS